MDPASILLKLLGVAVLIAINAYFVAAEFALAACRRSRIEQLARSGDSRASRVLRALDEPESFISTVQLGITSASIGVGFVAEGMLHAMILPHIERMEPLLRNAPLIESPEAASHLVGIVITLLIVTFLHVVIGEQVPKMAAIQHAEAIAMWTVAPTQLLSRILRPLISLMRVSAGALMQVMGLKPTSVHALAHTIDELRLLVEQSHDEGIVKADQEQMITSVFEFRETLAREVMTPRPDILGLPIDSTWEEALGFAAEEGHSRIPVYDGTLDDIVGVLLAKDLLAAVVRDDNNSDIRSMLREPLFVPDTKRIDALLAELRTRSVHMAIVVDEFGGTMGLVTLEDLIEEIVGDIYDEHDLPDRNFEITPEGETLIDGGTSISEVNVRLGLSLREADFDTVGGFVFGELGRMPVPGDTVPLVEGGFLRVEETLERRVTRVRLLRAAADGVLMTDAVRPDPTSPGG